MLFTKIDNYKIAYNRLGNNSGETILFIHGITTNSFIWRKILPFFESDFDIITIDLLGCGESDMPLDVSYSLKEHSNRLFKFVEQLNLKKFHIVGHDVGGGIVQIFAASHANKLYSLTMANMVGYDYWPVQPITAMRIPIIRQFIMGAFEFGLMNVLIKAGVYHKENIDRELIDLFLKPLKTSLGRKAFIHFANALDSENLLEITSQLKKVKLPSLIIRGDADPFLNGIIAERLHQDLANSQLERIATASHFIMEDEPEWMAKKILNFLREHHV